MPLESAGLFEVHLPVANLERSVTFYRDRLGLPVAHVVPERQAAFLWVPARGEGMLGLWGAGAGPQHVTLHVAFRASVETIGHAADSLARAGITPLDFDGQPATEPVVLAWMPAVSIYFRDPDGHLLEYIAMLPDAPRPELSVVSWSEWQARHT
jgi:lactoylglutathione lyase